MTDINHIKKAQPERENMDNCWLLFKIKSRRELDIILDFKVSDNKQSRDLLVYFPAKHFNQNHPYI